MDNKECDDYDDEKSEENIEIKWWNHILIDYERLSKDNLFCKIFPKTKKLFKRTNVRDKI